jgi:anhydro-N-acetylmuramic acid kinase
MPVLTGLGLMSGTSMDGIDLALVRTDGRDTVEFGPNGFVAYEPAFRRKLELALETAKAIVKREDRPGNLATVEREITRRHSEAVVQFLSGLPGEWSRPDVAGFHGQTVLHRPQMGLTVQLGDGPALARETGLRVVYDMRANDMANGGQGAPLVPVYHAALAGTLKEPWRGKLPVVFVNIGGISNITYVPETGDPIAFDTGPGNALIDQWVEREGGVPYDSGGAIASEGAIVEPVLARYLENSFFERPGPKSLDRNDFSLDLVERLELADGARTLAAVSAKSILKAAVHFPEPAKLWIICGGGRKNRTIVGDLQSGAERLSSEAIVSEEAGLNGDFTEAEAWGYLAVRALEGLPLTFPTTTGCRTAVTGGVIVPPPVQ